MEPLRVWSPDFENGGKIPVKFTGHGADVSPEFVLENIRADAKSIAILMDDMGHPVPAFSHWVIFNIPVMSVIPGGIPHGETVVPLGNAVQGRGYGRHRYRGPKPPFRWSHIYQFNVYVLDCLLDLPASAKKRDVLAAMEGHVIQQAALSGHYR